MLDPPDGGTEQKLYSSSAHNSPTIPVDVELFATVISYHSNNVYKCL